MGISIGGGSGGSGGGGGGGGAVSTILHSDPTEVVCSNSSTAEETLLSYTVPGGTLAAGDTLRLRAGGRFLNNTGGSVNLSLRLKLAGSNIIVPTSAESLSSTSQVRCWDLEFLINVITTTTEYMQAKLGFSGTNDNDGNWAQESTQYNAFISGGAFDLANDLAIAFSSQVNGNNSQIFVRKQYFFIEQIVAP